MTPAAHAEREVKHGRVLEVLSAHAAEALWLTSPAALAWYLGGARTHTSLVGPPVAALLVGPGIERVVTHVNEFDRLVAEELPEGIETHAVPWHAPLDTAIPTALRVIREAELEGPLRAARASLLPGEVDRFAALGRDAAGVLTRELRASAPDLSERDLAARIAGEVVSIGADPVVVLVAGASRLQHRHPLPTDAPLGERTMVVVCARRHGLVANLTRWVRHTEPDPEEMDRQHAIRTVESAYFAATRVGRRLSDVLVDGAAAYGAAGFDPDEWERHHQGGAAGYAGRDPRATPTAADLVQPNQAFAWNPSAPGQKIEDTVVLDDDRIRVLTADGDWPTVSVDGVLRPVELQL